MKKSNYLFVFIFTIFMACKESKPEEVIPKPVNLLTFTIDAAYPTSGSDNWIFIHNEDGQIIDYKAFESGQVLKFETTKNTYKKLNITLFHYYTKNDNTEHSFSTYLSVEMGQEWVLKKNASAFDNKPQAKIGDFKVVVGGVPSGYAAIISDKHGRSSNSGWSSDGYYNVNPSLYEEQQKYLLFVADNSGNPKYKFFENIKDKAIYNLQFHTMDNFDHLVEVKFPKSNNVNLSVIAWEENQPLSEFGYFVNDYINYYFNENELTSIKAGYLSRFTKYSTELKVNYTNLSYYYSKLGSKPEKISFPTNATFTLQDKSLNNFAFSSNQPFVRRSSTWFYNEQVNNKRTSTIWNTYAPQGAQKIGELPTQFLAQYPLLQLGKLKHLHTTFYTQAQTYNDFVNQQFKGEVLQDNTEIYSVSLK